MPTLAPGWNLVPRWRTRMLPARTDSPPNFLTPRRRPAVSRPFRDEPPAFLCAIEPAPYNSESRRLCGIALRLGLGLLRLARPWLLGRLALSGFGLRSLLLRRNRWLRAVGQDLRDPHQREILPVAVAAPRIVTPALLEDDDLRAALVLDDLRCDRSTGDERRAEGRLVAPEN